MQTLDEYKEEIIRNMRSVGTYKDSFANTVDDYRSSVLRRLRFAEIAFIIMMIFFRFLFRIPDK